MKSTHLSNFTQDAEDIEIIDVAKPQPGPGQVRVRMLLSPVNPSDLNFVHRITSYNVCYTKLLR